MPRKLPKQKPGRSRQDYQTPEEFLEAVRRLLRIDTFAYDLAASDTNHILSRYGYYTEADSAFDHPWATGPDEWNWCNPPFGNIEPWVRKAWMTAYGSGVLRGNTAVLCPGSIGTLWWQNWVYRKGLVLALRPRLTFVGESDPYPKDLALILYNSNPVFRPGFQPWNWQGVQP